MSTRAGGRRGQGSTAQVRESTRRYTGGPARSRRGNDQFTDDYRKIETTRAAYNAARDHYQQVVNSAPQGGFVQSQSPEFRAYIDQSRAAREAVTEAYQRYSLAFQAAQFPEAERVSQADGTGVRVYYADEQALHTVDATFGRHVSRSEFARISGLPENSRLVLGSPAGLGGPTPSFTMQGQPLGARSSYFDTRFMRGPDGAVTLLSPVVRNDRGRTAASGREVVRGLLALRKMGVDVIKATAQRGSRAARASQTERDWNGYDTWAKMKFTGPVPAGLNKAVRDTFPALANERNPRVEQVMAQPGGPAWWKENGRTWDATLDFRQPDVKAFYDALERRLGTS